MQFPRNIFTVRIRSANTPTFIPSPSEVTGCIMNYDEQKLKVNEALHRLELEVDGSIAFIECKLVRDKLFLIHTEVPPALEGKGAASAIVQKA